MRVLLALQVTLGLQAPPGTRVRPARLVLHQLLRAPQVRLVKLAQLDLLVQHLQLPVRLVRLAKLGPLGQLELREQPARPALRAILGLPALLVILDRLDLLARVPQVQQAP